MAISDNTRTNEQRSRGEFHHLQQSIEGFKVTGLSNQIQQIANNTVSTGESLPGNSNPSAKATRSGSRALYHHMAELMKLRQTGSVEQYRESFNSLFARLELPVSYGLLCFISGLKDEIRTGVRMFNPRTLHEAYCLALLQEATLASIARKTTPSVEGTPSPIRVVQWSPIQQSTVVAEEEDSLQPKFGVDNHPAMDAPQVFDESPKPSTCIKSDERNGQGLEYAQEGLETVPCEQLGGVKPSSGSLENSDRCVQEEVSAGGQMDDETFSAFGSILPCTKGCGFETTVDAFNGKKSDEKGWYAEKSQNKAEGEAEMKQKFEQTTKETVVSLVFYPGEEMDTTVFSSGMLNSVRNGPKEWYDHMHPSKAAIQLIKYQDHDSDLVTVTCVDELRLAEASMDVNSEQDPTVIVKGNGEKSSSQAAVPDAKSDETTPTVERSGLAPGSLTAHSSNELQDRDGNLAALATGTADASSTVAMTHEVSQEVEIPAVIKVEVVPSFLNGESSNGNVSPIPSRVPLSEFVNPGTELGLDNHSKGPGQKIELKDSADSMQPRKEKTHSVLEDADGKKSKLLDGTAAAIPNVTKKGNDREQTSLNKRQEPLEEAQGLLKSANSSGHSKETRLARVCAGFSSQLEEYKFGSAQLEELLAAARELTANASCNWKAEGSMTSLQANVETTLVNLIHYASLVATNAERHQMMAGKSKMLLEFGLTQAQGPGGGVSAARCCYLGGFDATCNVAARSLLGIPLKGTHSHAFVSLFMNPDEIVEKSPCSVDGSTTCEDFVGLVHTRLHKILRTRVSVEDQLKLKLLDGFELGKVKLQQVLIQVHQKLQQTSNVQLHTAIGVLVAIILLSLVVRLFKRKKSNRIVLARLPGGGKTVLFYSSHQGAVTSRDPKEGTFMLHSESTKRGQFKSVNLVDVPGHSHLRPKLDEYLPQAVGLMFVVDDIDLQIHEWKKKSKYIGLYGGDSVEWMRRFPAKEVAIAAGMELELVYVVKGKEIKERLQKIIRTMERENPSHYWPDSTSAIVHQLLRLSTSATPRQSPPLALQPWVVFLLTRLLLHTIHHLEAPSAVFDPGGDLVSKYIGPSPSKPRAGTIMGTLACSLLRQWPLSRLRTSFSRGVD